jgi:hypothetical protein
VNQNEMKRISESMGRDQFVAKFTKREASKYDDAKPWFANAIMEDRREKFRAILVKTERSSDPRVVRVDDLDDEHLFWKVERSCRMSRSAAEIAKLARPILRQSREIVLVDPFLISTDYKNGPSCVTSRHLSSLAAILQQFRWDAGRYVAYHCGDKELSNGGITWGAVDTAISRCVPRGFTLIIRAWPQRELHNRFILTDIGGLSFGHGLDEDINAARPGRDDVSLLDEAHWRERWNEFRHAPSRVVQHIVNGNGPVP